jgi:hypothetical protein
MDSTKQKLESLLEDLSRVNKLPRLSAAVDDVDKIIALLSSAREQVAGGELPLSKTAGYLLTDLQHWTPIRRA